MFNRFVSATLFLMSCSLCTRGQGPGSEGFWHKLPDAGKNNVWYEQNASDTAIVFVHGIFSDSRACWLYKSPEGPDKNQYWPEIVRYDSRFGHPAIFLGGFYTTLDAGPYDTEQAAKELREAIKLKGVLTKANLIFVAHSTGGIVVRYLLYHNQDLFANRLIGLALYASPSTGSDWAATLGWLADFYGQKLGKQLQPNDPFLTLLDHNFRDLLYNPNENKNRLGIEGAEAVENHFIIHRKYIPDKYFVVPESSGSRYFGSPTYIRNTDHFSIVKPTGLSDPSHEFLLSFYKRYQSKEEKWREQEPRARPPVEVRLERGGFTPTPSGNQGGKCDCGSPITVLTPGNQLARVGQSDVPIKWDAAPICIGITTDNPNGTVEFKKAGTSVLTLDLPDSYGTAYMTFRSPGYYSASFKWNSICRNIFCKNACSSTGTATIRVGDQ